MKSIRKFAYNVFSTVQIYHVHWIISTIINKISIIYWTLLASGSGVVFVSIIPTLIYNPITEVKKETQPETKQLQIMEKFQSMFSKLYTQHGREWLAHSQ